MSADPGGAERRGVAWRRRIRRLILVDEDAWCRGIADGVLRGCGYRLVCTGDPETAVRIAHEMLPDLVLADVRLSLTEPVPTQQRRRTDGTAMKPLVRPLSGYALLRPLEADPALVSCPVVLLKESDGIGDASERPRFGVMDYVTKPFAPQTLLEKVEKSLHTLGPAEGAGAAATFAATARARPESDAWNPRAIVMEGRIDFIGVPAVLEMFHFNQFTGVCSLRAGDERSAYVGFEDGEIVSASTSEGIGGVDAVFRILSWTSGRFAFSQTRPARNAALKGRFEQLILEGLRRLDEERRYVAAPLRDLTAPRKGWNFQES